MNHLTVSSVLIIVECLGLSVLSFLKSKGNKASKIWGLFCLFAVVWGVGCYIVSTSSSKEAAFLGWQIAFVGTIICPVFFAHFVFAFLNINRKIILIASYLLAAIAIGYDIFTPHVFFGDLKFLPGLWSPTLWAPYWLKYKGFIFIFKYIALYWVLLPYTALVTLKHYKHSTGVKRNQLKYFILGMLIGWIGPEGMYIPVIFPFKYSLFLFNFLIAWYPIPITYAILKYHLMDIRVAITRIGIFAGIYTLLLGVPFYIGYQTKQWVLAAVILAVFATIGPVVYRYLQRKADEIFFKKSRQYQRIILETSEDILAFKDKDVLLEKIASLIYENVLPSFVALYILEKQKYALKILKPRDKKIVPGIDLNNPLLERLKHKEGFAMDMHMDDVMVSMAMPIGQKEEINGLFLLGEKKDKAHYTPDDVETFRALLNQTSLALENVQHIQDAIEEQREKDRLKKEMDMAQQIQASLLPDKSPRMEGADIEGQLLVAKEVAGDYYDFISYSPQKTGIVVADVSGKGLDSGMVMSMTKSTIYSLSERNLSPRDMVISLNRLLCKQLKQQKFISLIYAEYLSAENTFVWAGAGHEHVLVYRAKEKPEVEVIKTGGIVLGMFGDIDDKIPQQSINLNKGARVVLYSDGVTEARNPEDNMFSLKRLVKTVQDAPNLPVKDFLDYIREEIKKFMASAPQYDDITLVVLGRE